MICMDAFFGCGKNVHMVRDCPRAQTQGRQSNQAQRSSPSFDAPKSNRFCALKSRGDEEDSPNVIIGMLKAFSTNMYALFDPRATLSFVTPLVAMKFDVLSDVLVEFNPGR